MRNLSMIRAARAWGADVDLISVASNIPEETAHVLGRYCRDISALPGPRRSILRRAVDTARSPLPDMAKRLWTASLDALVRNRARERSYDLVQVEGIEMARFVMDPPMARRIVFDDHNVEHLLQERTWKVDRQRPGKIAGAVYSGVQARKLRAFEQSICTLADAVITVSSEDAEAMSQFRPTKTTVIPNALDLGEYQLKQPEASASPTLIFPGTMDFRPNADAALWFIDRALPLVTRDLPDVQCFFAGRGPRPELVRRGQMDPRVAVTGAVPDMLPYWRRASICILPLQVGGGTRFKALEAMALGVPIVSTTLGMEGIQATPGLDYLRADDPASFAASIIELSRSHALRSSLSERGRAIVETHYTQAAVDTALANLYDSLL
jgi:glycosyltransferase involved in cell wall biosynthesis